MYIPANAITLTGGQLTLATCTQIAQSVADSFAAVAAIGGGQPVVVSRVAGTFENITGISVDSRMDVQRRRANQETILFVANRSVAV